MAVLTRDILLPLMEEDTKECEIMSDEGDSVDQKSYDPKKKRQHSTSDEEVEEVRPTPKRQRQRVNHNSKPIDRSEWKHQCGECGNKFRRRHVLKDHMKTHIPKPPRETWKYVCEEKECVKRFFTALELHHHVAVHKPKKFSCDVVACEKRFVTADNLKRHMVTHAKDSPFRCTEPNCGSAFKSASYLAKHAIVHSLERLFKCEHPGCNSTFKTKETRYIHQNVHTKARPYQCMEPGCGKDYTLNYSLIAHSMIHRGERPHKCDDQQFSCPGPNCGSLATFGLFDDFKLHVEQHHSNHWLKNAYLKSGGVTCEYATNILTNLRTHQRSQHRQPKSRRMIRREARVQKALTSAGLRSETGVYIQFSCFDSNGQYAKIDFQVHGREDSSLCLVEVDQFQHSYQKHYTQACERRRLLDVVASLQSGQFAGVRILFIRFNPDHYTVDGTKKKNMSVTEKERKLVDVIKNTPLPDDGRLLTLLYMFYDSKFDPITKKMQACVLLEDEEVPQMLKDCAIEAAV